MAVVLPHGTLFRMGAEGKIRQKILEMDLLEAVIAWRQICSMEPPSQLLSWCFGIGKLPNAKVKF